jgi:CheY-like chemotaxis protein
MKKIVIGIFEDDAVNRFIYERLLLTRNDVEVHMFDDPEKGVAAAKQVHFDIAFIEIHFWGTFGGVNILNKLKKNVSAPMTTVAMAAFIQDGDRERILGSGFDFCLEKPISFSSLDLKNIADAASR